MESYGLPQGGFQLPVQRRLSRLYTDTKKSSDFVKQPIQSAEDPDTKALHRKLKIQNDRLVTWGLGWSDPGNADVIDDALSKAGVSEVVGSIMSNIKDILAEAEPLWASSRRQAGGQSSRPLGDKKIPIVPWDKAKFQELIQELTTCIDTLYDLSRTRSSTALSTQVRTNKSTSAEDMRAFESTRMHTPQKIEPQTLTSLNERQPMPMSDTTTQSLSRDIVYMSKQAYSDLTRNNGRPYTALLLEYAEFDPMFAQVGIMPDMSRFEKLSAGLQTETQRSPGSWTGIPQLMGYFEDLKNSRLGLVYHFPPSFNPVSFESITHNTLNTLCSLADLLARPDSEPPLEAKFRLAFNLSNTVFDMHARGITHGNLINSNVSFCKAVGIEASLGSDEVDIRRPLVSSFDLFSDSFQESSTPSPSLYRHPLDPKTTGEKSLLSNSDSKSFDLYSLAMLLLSIGLWTPLENLVSISTTASIPESVLEQLATRCGTLYMKAVQTCYTAVDEELRAGTESDQIMTQVQVKTSRFLEACALLDSVGGLEDRLGSDLGIQLPVPPSEKAEAPVASSSREAKAREAGLEVPKAQAAGTRGLTPAVEPLVEPQRAPSSSEPKTRRSNKCRLYPHAALAPELVDHWNNVLMPRVNEALHHFYRKHPESVEISLESIGESAKETKPTVLVVCTSVSKVKAILKRKLDGMFDGSAGFALKVCRGQVLRSRKDGTGTKRSNARSESAEDVVAAANGGYQERPSNGASIGAWVGDRHLPPVSFGGLVVVDAKTYGMTVHHMLDDPDADQTTLTPKEAQRIQRSMAGSKDQVPDLAGWYAQHYSTESPASGNSSDSEDFAAEFSDAGSDLLTESAITSEYSESDGEEEENEYSQPGDIPGVEPGCGDGYIISQPALDDVDEDFYAGSDSRDDDHLDSFSLGELFASSGIRRRGDERGLIHEIDWALFEFNGDRLPGQNAVPRAAESSGRRLLYPKSVLPATALPNMEVQCMARTSGLQFGLILPALTSVKIYGRISPSHTYQVTSSLPDSASGDKPRLPLGLPGDSGAWIIERNHGQVCGHVVAFSQRKKVAYICPMDVLLLDIAETLEASVIKLPGGEPVVRMLGGGTSEGYHAPLVVGDASDVDAELRSMAAAKRRSMRKGKGSVEIKLQSGEADRPVSMVEASASRGAGDMPETRKGVNLGSLRPKGR